MNVCDNFRENQSFQGKLGFKSKTLEKTHINMYIEHIPRTVTAYCHTERCIASLNYPSSVSQQPRSEKVNLINNI